MKVGWDLDGVVYPFFDVFQADLTAQGYAIPSKPPEQFSLAASRGMSEEQVGQLMDDSAAREVLYRVGDPLPGSIEAARRVARAGHTIHVVTARPEHDYVVASTMAWLNEVGFPYSQVMFTEAKADIDVDTFIEDNLNQYDRLDAAGRLPYLLDCPWNQHPAPRRRVSTLAEFADLVMEGS